MPLLDKALDLVLDQDVAALVQGDVPVHCDDRYVTDETLLELHEDLLTSIDPAAQRRGFYAIRSRRSSSLHRFGR